MRNNGLKEQEKNEEKEKKEEGEERAGRRAYPIVSGSDAMSDVQQWIEADFPGIYVHNMEV